jgi:hypothetical protein
MGDQVEFDSASERRNRAIGSLRIVKRAGLSFLLLVAAICAAQPGAAATISLAGIDYHRLCRDTEHVPLVQAAIDPAYINVWSIEESQRAGRFEQYSFVSQRVDVRAEHEISLYHGLIHRTLDVIGESEWKHRDLQPHEDREHWLIYHTLETHWPGAQRRQGREPSPATLLHAGEYWRQHAARYAEIVAKATTLAGKSWCAANSQTREAQATIPPAPLPRAKSQLARLTPSPVEAVPPSPTSKPAPQVQPTPALPPSRSTARPHPGAADTLSVEPIWVMSEFLDVPSAHQGPRPVSPWESQWASSPP